MAIVKADKAGMSYVVPMTDMAPKLVGLDGTHIAMKFALLGSGAANALTPSVLFMSGSHTGGGANGALRSVKFNPAQAAAGFTATTTDTMDLAVPYDRHLYPNYLGNNPGNQGRNYANGFIVKSPFADSKDSHVMLYATTGKDASTMMQPQIKPAAFLSVVGVAQAPAATGGGSGSGSGGGSGSAPVRARAVARVRVAARAAALVMAPAAAPATAPATVATARRRKSAAARPRVARRVSSPSSSSASRPSFAAAASE